MFSPRGFSVSHFSDHKTKTQSFCDTYSRAGDIHMHKKLKPSANGVCFTLVIFWKFSYLSFMLKKILWSLRMKVMPFYSPHGARILPVCIVRMKTLAKRMYFVSICSRNRCTWFFRRAKKVKNLKCIQLKKQKRPNMPSKKCYDE